MTFQRFIWHSVLRYFVMFTEKLRQTLHPEEIHDAYWTILWQTMNCHNRLVPVIFGGFMVEWLENFPYSHAILSLQRYVRSVNHLITSIFSEVREGSNTMKNGVSISLKEVKE